MPCPPDALKHVPLFALLDDDEAAILAAQVELKHFEARQRIYKIRDPGRNAYVVLSGSIQVTTVDEDHQEVVLDKPARGEFFGFASMLDETPHKTTAVATSEAVCLEVDRDDISTLLGKKPMSGMNMLTALGRQYHTSQDLVRGRASRSPNELIDEKETFGERVADTVARFGGSWTFIILFAVTLTVYTATNVLLRGRAWDPYPFILLNLFLSMLAAIQAPVIMMSQNRQDTKDRVRSELDFKVNVRSESEIQAVASKLNQLADKVGDLDELLRTTVRQNDKSS